MDCKVLLHDLLLIMSWLSVNLGVDFGISEEILIVLHELLACLVIQTAFWKRYNQQTLNDLEYIRQRPACWVPILFQGVYTDFSRRSCNIRMENLSEEVPYIIICYFLFALI